MFTAMFIIAFFLAALMAFYALRGHLRKIRFLKTEAAQRRRSLKQAEERLQKKLRQNIEALGKGQSFWLEVLSGNEATHRLTFTLVSGLITCTAHPEWSEARTELNRFTLKTADVPQWSAFILECFSADSPEDIRIKSSAV